MREDQAAGTACARLESRGPGPDERAACREAISGLHLALRQLSEEDLQIVRWEYFEGRTAAQANGKIARELGIGIRWAKKRRARVLERLRGLLVERAQGTAR
jgi:DNA-directed RNA polymerase specialized sigma24 family protein